MGGKQAPYPGFTPFPRTVWLSLKHTADAFPFVDVFVGYGIVRCSRRYLSCFSPNSMLSAIYSFPFEHAKETFRCCIVGTAAYRTHAANQIAPLPEALVLVTGKLTAAIRMRDNRDFPWHCHGAMSPTCILVADPGSGSLTSPRRRRKKILPRTDTASFPECAHSSAAG